MQLLQLGAIRVGMITSAQYLLLDGWLTEVNVLTQMSRVLIFAGLPLISGWSSLVYKGDPDFPETNNLGKTKVRAWRGHNFIDNPETDVAGVDWILAEGWWPYQRPSFVTPPFAGYVSGHSTFSRAAAEIMTSITGDEYFPGGMGEFIAEQDEFLVFEDGPSEDIVLQWATYRDASDQCSLSEFGVEYTHLPTTYREEDWVLKSLNTPSTW